MCVTAIYVMHFLYLLEPFTDQWGRWFFKQKEDLIITAKMFKGTPGVVSSPNSSVVYGRFILQCWQMLTHLTVSVSQKPKGSQKGSWIMKG